MQHRYPTDVNPTIDDFRACGWREVVGRADCTSDAYSAIWTALTSAAEAKLDEGRRAEGAVLWLLGDAMSMMLKPSSNNGPYTPYYVFENGRGPMPEDFSPEQIALLAEIVSEIDNAWLRARVADLIWLVQKPRNRTFALMAIDAYKSIDLTRGNWASGGQEGWERAIRLARTLGRGADSRVPEMEGALIDALMASEADEDFFGSWVADLLGETGLGMPRAEEIAVKLASLGDDFDAKNDVFRARAYFNASAKWYGTLKKPEESASMLVRAAETWVKEATLQASGEAVKFMLVAHNLEQAIQAFRRIPVRLRPAHAVEQRIAELRQRLTEASERSVQELRMASTGVDLSDAIARVRTAVSGKSPIDALKAFANITGGVSEEKLRETSLEMMRRHPLQMLASTSMISRDGRVIAKRPALSLFLDEESLDEAAISAQVTRHHGMQSSLLVQGAIWPALEVLVLEQRFPERDLILIAQNAPVVPPDRAIQIGKGLYQGFEQNFLEAIHLLAPQVEHLVRWHLKSRGVTTTTLDSIGIETEVGLSTLLEKEETKQIFAKDLLFELRALFTDPFGPNLRNEVAHGLLEIQTANTPAVIYAWWWCFRLVFGDFLRMHEEATHETGDAAEVQEPEEA